MTAITRAREILAAGTFASVAASEGLAVVRRVRGPGALIPAALTGEATVLTAGALPESLAVVALTREAALTTEVALPRKPFVREPAIMATREALIAIPLVAVGLATDALARTNLRPAAPIARRLPIRWPSRSGITTWLTTVLVVFASVVFTVEIAARGGPAALILFPAAARRAATITLHAAVIVTALIPMLAIPWSTVSLRAAAFLPPVVFVWSVSRLTTR